MTKQQPHAQQPHAQPPVPAEATAEPPARATAEQAVASACCGGGVSRLDNDDATELATRLAALADPVRLQMLSIISSSDTGEVCACDFVGPIGKSQPTVSHHLRVLSDAGLVLGEKRGRWIWYRVRADAIDAIVRTLGEAMR